jgi:phosphate transport system substrate-binding protein
MFTIKLRDALLGTCAVAALAVGASGTAQAQVTQIRGGGSSLAAPTYGVIFNAYQQLIDTTVNFNYGSVGSGAGQRGVLCNDAAQDGFAGGLTVHFGASDATLSGGPTGQIAHWNASNDGGEPAGASSPNCSTAGAGTIGQNQGGPLIQVPSFGTPITIAFNTPGQKNSGQLQLTDTQLCGIFSGKITSWTDPAMTNIVTKGAAPTGTITPVYRVEGSGTTFLFTQHLNAVCNATTSNISFTATQTFASLFTSVPANFVAASNSSGVSAAIGISAANNGGVLKGTSGSIGYLSPDFTIIANVHAGARSSFAPVAAVFNTSTSSFWLPDVPSTVAALAQGTPPSSVADLKDPTKYVPPVPAPGNGYPIVGYTVIIIPTCYADNNVAATILGILNAMYTIPDYIGLVQQNGFASLPNNLLTPISQNILNNNPATNVDIQNANVCIANGGSLYAGR